MRSFGESGPAAKVIAHFGFTADAVAEAAMRTAR
jgi:transketolase